MSQSRIEDGYEVLELIGKGSFGNVRKVRDLETGNLLVRKEVQYGHMNHKEREQLVSEFRILSELKNPYIVEYIRHSHYSDRQVLFLYMEYCNGGDLSSIIKKYKKDDLYVPEELIWDVFTQMLMALYRCHYGVEVPEVQSIYKDFKLPVIDNTTKVFIHRDIKPDNIFIAKTTDRDVYKLGDFGLAKSLTSESAFAVTCVGTPYYMSPEILLDRPYSPLCDIWSLGCVIYELCSLKPPFTAKTHLQLQKNIQNGEYPPIPNHYSYALENVINKCIQVDLNNRATTFDLIQLINFKIHMKDLKLKEERRFIETELRVREQEALETKRMYLEDGKRQKELMNTLLVKEQEVNQLRNQAKDELIQQRESFELSMERLQADFNYRVEKEVKAILKQQQPLATSPARTKIPLYQQNEFQANSVPLSTSPSKGRINMPQHYYSNNNNMDVDNRRMQAMKNPVVPVAAYNTSPSKPTGKLSPRTYQSYFPNQNV
ncbi:hypothetical protein WICPIJ_005310 [Wickerhamomyces pijperi]|uniref:non-specific serine/threonine protein kinase n=1 Tax=Wickerhamomyces pijperi TaxID=599730 RepID=A0A9P8TMH6_WICPI|nr:hypothetical protein WICPIJ_005310 [Wickerhamomyces pijperi]